MKALTLRKFTQSPLLPNRILKWIENYGNRIEYDSRDKIYSVPTTQTIKTNLSQ